MQKKIRTKRGTRIPKTAGAVSFWTRKSRTKVDDMRGKGSRQTFRKFKCPRTSSASCACACACVYAHRICTETEAALEMCRGAPVPVHQSYILSYHTWHDHTVEHSPVRLIHHRHLPHRHGLVRSLPWTWDAEAEQGPAAQVAQRLTATGA